jgi:molybdenum cofactor biosynthesis protein B
MPAKGHVGKSIESVLCAVVTVSDTRTVENDKSGRLIHDMLEGQGHRIGDYRIIKDEPDEIRKLLKSYRAEVRIAAVLITGGTGLARRDTTFEAISGLLDKTLDGFGELFRSLSYDDIGSGAMLTRATAGIIGSMAVFSMPGSTGAVRLAMEKLILPELGHIAYLLEE